MTSTNDKRDLVQNEEGAIMIMGLAMILGLIAFLWFVLGLGETLAFRDHMQESADSAAFTQPAVEALCMNLIVLINLIMMIMVGIYIIASVVVTGLWASSVLCCPTPAFLACCPRIITYYNAWNKRNDAAKIMADADGFLSPLESIIAIGAPWAGSGLSYLASSDYKMSSMDNKPIGFAVSPMNIPGTFDLGSTTKRFGLPVTHDYLGNDCTYILTDLASLLGSAVATVVKYFGNVVQYYYCDNSVIPPELMNASNGNSLKQDGGKTESGDDPSGAVDKNGNPVQKTITTDKFPPDSAGSGSDSTGKCDTDNGTSTAGGIERLIIGGGDGGNYWNCGKYGPMMNYAHGDGSGAQNPSASGHDKEYKNGADEMQSYGMVFIPGAYSDHHATHNIAFMQLHNAGWSNTAEVKPSTYGYYAQAELYFDCSDKWSSDSCDNIAGQTIQDMTMYKFEWRSRLVKVHFPGGLGQVVTFLNDILGMVSSVRSFINGKGADQIVSALNAIDPSIVSGIGAIADPIPAALAH